ncbi:MAG: transglutaminase-like domain-containing protein [Gemmatimonadales bacterium]|nr:transglutaminase-like domain-containing protein [Gemmatimonadales bacterium]
MVVVAWLAGLGLLLKREYFKSSTIRLAEAATRVGPGASYYTLSMGGGPIGYAASTVDTIGPTSPGDTTTPGVRVQDVVVIDIEALGSIQRVELTTDILLTRALHVRSFQGSLNSEAARMIARGSVEGDSVLVLEIDAGGSRPSRQRIRLERPIILPAMLPLQLAFGGELRIGRTYRLRMFDPIAFTEREVAVQVQAESTLIVPDSALKDPATGRWVVAREDTVHAWKVAEETGGIITESWIDDQGSIVRAVSPVGFRMERTAFELAVENWRRNRGAARVAAGQNSDIIQSTAIAANLELAPEALTTLRVRLGNVTLQGFDLGGGRQRLAGDTLIVTRETGFGDGPGGPRPTGFDARLPISASDPALASALAAEALVQSDDPRIQAQARRIVGRERRAGVVAELLTHWVYDNLEKKITVSVPSAAQVLENRSGDCNEHTVLYVALARALGLPARTAAGVVYLRGHFYYHAWPEVWLGQWAAVDPTFNQFPADAAHLRFVNGGLARQVELIRLIGRLQLTVIPGT